MFTVRHYSQALFESAKEEKKLDKFLADLELVFFAIKENKDLNKFLVNPEVSLNKKSEIFKDIFGKKITESIYNLIYLLIKKNNLKMLGDVFYNFKNKVLEEKCVVEANVTFAVEPKKSDEGAIIKKLEEKTDKKIKLIKSIDPRILGGIIAKVGDELLDLSLKRKLEMLRVNLI